MVGARGVRLVLILPRGTGLARQLAGNVAVLMVRTLLANAVPHTQHILPRIAFATQPVSRVGAFPRHTFPSAARRPSGTRCRVETITVLPLGARRAHSVGLRGAVRSQVLARATHFVSLARSVPGACGEVPSVAHSAELIPRRTPSKSHTLADLAGSIRLAHAVAVGG